MLANIRKSCCDKLARVPLGYVKDTPSGTFKNIMVERIDSIETTLAHIVPEFTSNLLASVVILIYKVVCDTELVNQIMEYLQGISEVKSYNLLGKQAKRKKRCK